MTAEQNEPTVPVSDLRALVEEWREKPGVYNPEYITDLMHDTTQNECATELEELVEQYE
jgi:hypothetical protein